MKEEIVELFDRFWNETSKWYNFKDLIENEWYSFEELNYEY